VTENQFGTPFQETEALLAVALDDIDAARKILREMLPAKLAKLDRDAGHLADLCAASSGCAGSHPRFSEFPQIACICCSTKFRDEIADADRRLTLEGYIVVAPGVFAHNGDEMTDEQKTTLDELHLRKLDLADVVYVVNPNGYINQSTAREIAYARTAGKTVRFLAEEAGDHRG